MASTSKVVKLSAYCQGKTYVFIDAANIFYSQKTLGWRIKFERLHDYLNKECDLGEVYFYYSQSDRSPGQQKFFAALRKIGYSLRVKPLKIIKGRDGTIVHKGNLDIEMAFDVMDHLDNFETMILMSGDSDFEAVVRRVRLAGKKVIILSTRGHVSKEIIGAATRYIDLRKLRIKIAFANKKSGISSKRDS